MKSIKNKDQKTHSAIKWTVCLGIVVALTLPTLFIIAPFQHERSKTKNEPPIAKKDTKSLWYQADNGESLMPLITQIMPEEYDQIGVLRKFASLSKEQRQEAIQFYHSPLSIISKPIDVFLNSNDTSNMDFLPLNLAHSYIIGLFPEEKQAIVNRDLIRNYSKALESQLGWKTNQYDEGRKLRYYCDHSVLYYNDNPTPYCITVSGKNMSILYQLFKNQAKAQAKEIGNIEFVDFAYLISFLSTLDDGLAMEIFGKFQEFDEKGLSFSDISSEQTWDSEMSNNTHHLSLPFEKLVHILPIFVKLNTDYKEDIKMFLFSAYSKNDKDYERSLMAVKEFQGKNRIFPEKDGKVFIGYKIDENIKDFIVRDMPKLATYPTQ